MKSRTLYIAPEINNETYYEFHKEVLLVHRDGIKKVDIMIHSDGGLSFSGLAYHDTVKDMVSRGIQVTGHVYGCAMSAATLIFAACPNRKMAKSAWLMLHEDQHSDDDAKSTTELELYTVRARKLENQWLRLMAQNTGISFDQWHKLHQGENWLDYSDCLNLGLIHED